MASLLQLPLCLLDDELIECGDYDDWTTARHEIRRHAYDRSILDDLLLTIPRRGLDNPLWLEVLNGTQRVAVSDGHHRAVALMELGAKEFPYRWRWRFPRWRGQRLPLPPVGEPLPADVLHRLMEGARRG